MTQETGEGHHDVPASEDDLLRELLEEHAASVYRMARSVVRDPALAEDVTQETFVKAWQHADTYRGTAPVRHWLLRIAHNVAVSTLLTIRDEATDPAKLPRPSRAEAATASVVEDRLTITDALGSLDPMSRSIVVLREVEGFTYAEIGQILELPLPTVKTRLFRARGRLQKMAEDQS